MMVGCVRISVTVTVPVNVGGIALADKPASGTRRWRLGRFQAYGVSGTTLEMPFTLGTWQESEAVTIPLEEGGNILRFSARWAAAVCGDGKAFTLTLVD